MQDYKQLYNSLKEEYKTYQVFSEARIQELNSKNIKLEKNIDSLSNIVEISKYINTYFTNDNLIGMINDMIIGILGVTYSTIFLVEHDELTVKASNIDDMKINLTSAEIMHINKEEEFLLNSKEALKQVGKNKSNIHSIMGVPIKLREKFLGYIIVEHNLYNFMNLELEMFLQSIANQIAIAIENYFLYRELENLTKKDPLLNIYNRNYFFEFLHNKVEKDKVDKFAIVMMDIDDFKEVNDTYGHQFGDEVLINTSNIIKRWLDKDDIIARYGGEEFILYISDFIDEGNVISKIEIIRRAIEDSKISVNGETKSITSSFGISFFPQNGTEINKLIKVSDDLLYKAKNNGKNKVLASNRFKN